MGQEPNEGIASPLDDMATFMATLKRGGYMARELMARRPARETLGAQLQLFLKMVQTSIEAGRIHGTLDDIQVRPGGAEANASRYDWEPWMPLAPSPCRAEFDALQQAGWPDEILQNGLTGALSRPLSLARRLVTSAIDHLTGVALLLQHESTIRSPLALSRVALEAASRAWFVLDEELTPSERLGRVWNIELDNMAKERDALRKKHQLDPGPVTEKPLREVGRDLKTRVEDLVRLGLSRSAENKNRIEPYLGSATAIVDLLLNRADGSTYNELSKVVHSQDDGGMFVWLRDGEDGLRHPQRDRLIALNLMSTVIALFQAVRRLAWYTGWDFGTVLAMESQVLGSWAVGSGLHDTELEKLVIAEGWTPPQDATVEFWRRVQQQVDEQDRSAEKGGASYEGDDSVGSP